MFLSWALRNIYADVRFLKPRKTWKGPRQTFPGNRSLCTGALYSPGCPRCHHYPACRRNPSRFFSAEWNPWEDPNGPKLPELHQFPPELIRNFCIVAHVDHGKSTLADRLLELAGNIKAGSHDHQVLDRLEVERERGITVKAQTASLFYTLDGKTYLLNLIDTPGHVDFNYEVQRSLTAVQGVVLLVDANQGVQAQTLATFFSSFEAEKSIIPVLNKIDLKGADPDAVALQMKKALDIDPEDCLKISAKVGTGVEDLFRAIIERVPPCPESDAYVVFVRENIFRWLERSFDIHCPVAPKGIISRPFKGLLFDSWYDKYRGVIALVAIIDGQLKRGDEVVFLSTGKSYEIRDIGILRPERTSTKQLFAGQVGFICCNMRTAKEAQIGETLYAKDHPVEAITPIRKAKPMVFAGIFPEDQSENESLRNSLDKLLLNDSSVSVAMEHSQALGQGWRLGFLGLLHMEVFVQRLEYEHGTSCITTIPSVPYKAKLKGEKLIKDMRTDEITIVNPENDHGSRQHYKGGNSEISPVNDIILFIFSILRSRYVLRSVVEMPGISTVEGFTEPWIIGTIISPSSYMGEILGICMDRRGQQKNVTFLDETRVMLQFYMPLSEVIVDFFDELKSKTSGYASFDYENADYRPVDLSKVDFLLNSKVISELSMLAPVQKARFLGKRVCERLKATVPAQQFPVSIQAAIGGQIIAREDLKALRKDVIKLKIFSHGSGGDKGRKMKLLNRQKEGKARMRMVGNIEIPRDCFVKVLRKD